MRKPKPSLPMKSENQADVTQAPAFNSYRFHTFFGEERISYHKSLEGFRKRNETAVYISGDPTLHDEEKAALEHCRNLLAERKSKAKLMKEPVPEPVRRPILRPPIPKHFIKVK